MKKLILIVILILTSCASNDDENCNCREQIYERRYINSNSWDDRYINESSIDGCYTEAEATNQYWFTSDRFTIISCDRYL